MQYIHLLTPSLNGDTPHATRQGCGQPGRRCNMSADLPERTAHGEGLGGTTHTLTNQHSLDTNTRLCLCLEHNTTSPHGQDTCTYVHAPSAKGPHMLGKSRVPKQGPHKGFGHECSACMFQSSTNLNTGTACVVCVYSAPPLNIRKRPRTTSARASLCGLDRPNAIWRKRPL